MTTREARCSCGACSIQVRGDPALNAVCHCAECRRRTGSAFGWSVYFRNDQVTATLGAFRTYAPAGKAPNAGAAEWEERVFCGKCGTTLSWRASKLEGLTGIAGGCFSDAATLPPPTMTLDDGARCAWVTLPAGWKTAL
jgi:hypothetical protein